MRDLELWDPSSAPTNHGEFLGTMLFLLVAIVVFIILFWIFGTLWQKLNDFLDS